MNKERSAEDRLGVTRSDRLVPYRTALELQHELHSMRVRGDMGDFLWLLEHPPVLTTGLRADQSGNIRINAEQEGIDIVQTERGGQVTYHGPGQLVGYLFLGMERFEYRVRAFIHSLEEAFIQYLSGNFAIAARHDDHTGVWVRSDKITAIGIALRQRVTLHGFAFNINTDLGHYNWIVPCGIADPSRGVTSLQALLGEELDMARVSEALAQCIAHELGYAGVTPCKPEILASAGF